MRLPNVLALALALALALWPTSSRADPHPMASGATAAPSTETQVAIAEETLAIAMELRTASVRAAITLVNPGEATKLKVGFPCASGADAGAIDVPCKVPLRVTVNGKRVALRRERAGRKQTHWTWTMSFAAGARVEVVVAYRAPLLNDRYSVPAFGLGSFTYRLTTGARWAGPIGKLKISVEHRHDALLFVSPAGYQREPGRITWELTDHEPTEEVILIPHPMMGNRLASVLGGKTLAEAHQRLAAGDYAKADVEAAIAELRDQTDDDWLTGWLRIISRVGGFTAPSLARTKACIAESIALLEGMATKAKR
ncbi:MAG: hypothetical protein R3B48_17335 [Kofleriaceae bacterium]